MRLPFLTSRAHLEAPEHLPVRIPTVLETAYCAQRLSQGNTYPSSAHPTHAFEEPPRTRDYAFGDDNTPRLQTYCAPTNSTVTPRTSAQSVLPFQLARTTKPPTAPDSTGTHLRVPFIRDSAGVYRSLASPPQVLANPARLPPCHLLLSRSQIVSHMRQNTTACLPENLVAFHDLRRLASQQDVFAVPQCQVLSAPRSTHLPSARLYI